MNLLHGGVPLRRIWLTGNTIVDVVTKFEKRAEEVGQALISELGMSTGEYALLTIHRRENADNRERLSMVVEGVCRLARRMSIVFPVHPRTEKRLRKWGLWSRLEECGVRLIPPLGYLAFLGALIHARVVLTDSGGVQEEALTLGIPTVTLRYNTERPETVKLGVNVLAGVGPEEVVRLTLRQAARYEEVRELASRTPNPLGDGNAGKRIASISKELVESGYTIREFESREDPYITYALVDVEAAKTPGLEVLSCYGENGLAEVELSSSRKVVVRGPLSLLREVLNWCGGEAGSP